MRPDQPSIKDDPALGKIPFAERLSVYHSLRINDAVARCVLESDAVGLFLCTAEGTIREANDAFLHMLQYTREDLAGDSLTWQGITPPEFLERDYAVGRQVVLKGSMAPIEKQYIRRDGSRIDVLILASLIDNADDLRIITLVFDITDRRRARDLAASNLFLDTIFEHIPGFLFVKDAKTLRYLRFNKASEEYLRLTREEIFEKADDEIFPMDKAEEFKHLDLELLESGKACEYDHVLHVNGRGARLFHSKKLLIRDQNGEPQYILGFAEDMTEKREAEAKRIALAREQAAREEAERVAARLKILSEAGALVSSSLDYRTTLQNIARSVVPSLADWCVVEMFSPDGEREEVVMEHDFGVDAPRLDPTELYAIETEEEKNYGLDVVRHGPRYSTDIHREDIHRFTQNPAKRAILEDMGLVSYIAVPLHLRGSILGSVTLLTTKHSGRRFDANDLQLVQELARHAALAVDNARLYLTSQNMHRAKDEFLAVLSHELRTPLSVIHGYAEILKNEGLYLSDEERQEYYDIIYRNSEHQTRIVTDLLDVSAFITGKLTFNPQTVAPAEVVASVVQTVQPSAEAKGIVLTLRDEGVPESLLADPTRFQQIVWNLLSNAVKFTPHGGSVTTTIARRDNMFVLEVSDTGIGIEPDFLPHVFDRFRQEDGSATRRFGGLGLGLAIVRHLVELHGGKIKAESKGKGCGSTFTVTLPL